MPTLTSFTTPAARAEAEITVKKSRFIAHVLPIQSVGEADEALAAIRVAHKAANHNCFAYTVGLSVPLERYSDDGEPSGTAGRPILEVIRRQGLSNLMVVVTRYFGGTLLGANGLVRAYTEATVAALKHTPLLRCQQMVQLCVTADYSHFGKMEHELSQTACFVTRQDFGAQVTLEIWVSQEEGTELVAAVADWTHGQAKIVVSQPQWVGVDGNRNLVLSVWPEQEP